MSTTPRTDKHSIYAHGGKPEAEYSYLATMTMTDFARTLETELALANAENVKLRAALTRIAECRYLVEGTLAYGYQKIAQQALSNTATGGKKES